MNETFHYPLIQKAPQGEDPNELVKLSTLERKIENVAATITFNPDDIADFEQHTIDLTDQLDGIKTTFEIGNIKNENIFLNGILLIKNSDYTLENGILEILKSHIPNENDILIVNYITGNAFEISDYINETEQPTGRMYGLKPRYVKRFTGYIDAGVDKEHSILLTDNVETIIDEGGQWEYKPGWQRSVNNNRVDIYCEFLINNGNLYFNTASNHERYQNYYDIWIEYCKII
jgi:hypothetical protein